ncbi:hypothetical protein QA596_07920 [Balneolales bacterium ANBcel1]|nr:hypothetical protein [Balneolales bacterium ANBcel1]
MLHQNSYLAPLSTVLCCVLLFSISSCSDSTSSDDPSADQDIPDLPQFEQIQMQTGAFEEGSFSVKDTDAAPGLLSGANPISPLRPLEGETQQFGGSIARMVASNLVATFEEFHQTNVNLLSGLFADWNRDDAELSGGEYIWEYEIDDWETGQTFYLQVISSVSGDEAHWTAIASLEGQFEEQQVVEGTTALDGSSGVWSFHVDFIEQANEVESTIAWSIEDDRLADYEMEIAISTEDYYNTATGNYGVDGNIATISDAQIDVPGLDDAADNLPVDVDLRDVFHIEWNLETEAGSLAIGDQQFSWE